MLIPKTNPNLIVEDRWSVPRTEEQPRVVNISPPGPHTLKNTPPQIPAQPQASQLPAKKSCLKKYSFLIGGAIVAGVALGFLIPGARMMQPPRPE